MNHPHDSKNPPFDGPGDDPLDPMNQPYAQEPMEVEEDAPRRAASARFDVDAQVGSEAALRDAMDPANQSLADALRLSYRVLQAVIVVLVVLFLASGLRTIDDGKSGVRTVWGDIQGEGEDASLKPGLKFSLYPYPIGDFVVFDSENRSVGVGDAFAPASRGRTQDQMLETAQSDQAIMPGVDGALITREGDLAHIEFSATYIIDQPVKFVQNVNDVDSGRNADRLVKLALERAAIQVAASLDLKELVELTEDARLRIRMAAQEVLDKLGCGIQVTQVQLTRGFAPLFIEKALGDLTAAGVERENAKLEAEKNASKMLQEKAGGKAHEVIALIEQYEHALDRGNPQEHAQILAAINAILESPEMTGDVFKIIQNARGYETQVEQTLGLEYRRFDGFLAEYRANRQLFTRQQRLNVLANALKRTNDVEVFYVDPDMPMHLQLSGSSDVQDIRRDLRIHTKNIKAGERTGRRDTLRAGEMSVGKEGRTLVKTADGRYVPLGSDR